MPRYAEPTFLVLDNYSSAPACLSVMAVRFAITATATAMDCRRASLNSLGIDAQAAAEACTEWVWRQGGSGAGWATCRVRAESWGPAAVMGGRGQRRRRRSVGLLGHGPRYVTVQNLSI